MRSRRDLLCGRRLQLLDRVDLNRGWLGELSAYYKGLTIHEFWVRYTLERMDAATLWERKPRSTEADYRSFYAETDYFVLRQMYYHGNDCYHEIAATLRRAGRAGDFCEYGCGVAPVTAWLRPRFPAWRFTLVDLPTPALEFARWRFRRFPSVELKEPGFGTDLPLSVRRDHLPRRARVRGESARGRPASRRPPEAGRHAPPQLHRGAGRREPGGGGGAAAATIAYLNAALDAVIPLQVEVRGEVNARYVKPRR